MHMVLPSFRVTLRLPYVHEACHFETDSEVIMLYEVDQG